MTDSGPSETEIRLAEQEAFRRAQVINLTDALAAANGEIAVLRSRITALTPKTDAG